MDNRKRYQVFISSTFVDLVDERDKVMETILKLDCFPAGMELFPAMDEEQFEYIKKIIDDSDFYLLIIGGRYGSVDNSGVSWTEREYIHAVSKGIHVMVFDHIDFTKLPAEKTDQDNGKRKKLIAFKKKVSSGRLIRKWTNANDLALGVATSLPKVLEVLKQDPAKGWVRAGSVVVGDSQKEIDRFKKEIEKHQNEVKRLDAALKQKEGDYQTLELSYQAAQKEIENLNKLGKNLETELEKLKIFSVTNKTKPQVQTEIITIPGTDVSFKMVYVEGGMFMMGAGNDDKEAFPNEWPVHEVELSDYWIGETQVTQELWLAVMGYNPSGFTGKQNPVENVSWIDCQKFIERLNNKTGRNFHLPTEAQWEFAARGGNLGKETENRYAGRNYDLEKIAWYVANSEGKTNPVAKLYPNQLGLYDMSGNVWEWCQDWFDSKYYNNTPKKDPKGPKPGSSLRMCRGGSWNYPDKYCRVSCRDHYDPEKKLNTIGLRLAL